MWLGELPGAPVATPLAVWQASGELSGAHWIVHAPAFAEEMNKSRHLVARQARRFAANGHVVVVPDLCGTGDSPHSLEVATWQGWIDELCAVVAWARDQGAQSVTLWGLRLGSLLALQAAAQLDLSGSPPDHLLLWQPLLTGKLQMAQFLRLVTAAAVTGSGNGPSAASLKEALAEGDTVEVAGYPLSSALYLGVHQADTGLVTLPGRISVAVIEVATQADKPLLPVTARQLGIWEDGGIACTARTVFGDAFWATQELGFADALLARSDELCGPMLQRRAVPEIDERHCTALLSLENTNGEVVRPVIFQCRGVQLAGRLHVPNGTTPARTGVVIIVGGPQYRVGSHRQFVSLAEASADAGFPTLRFDYRGMGDSDGELAGFSAIHDDIEAAIDALQVAVPSVQSVVLWGLCDAATAAVVYAVKDARVAGLVLANPWVYSPQGAAGVKIKHYYASRALSLEFWRRLFSGQVALLSSIWDFAGQVARVVGFGGMQRKQVANHAPTSPVIDTSDLGVAFLKGLSAFPKSVLLFLSGHDFTAMEFERAVEQSSDLRSAVDADRVVVQRLGDADHTFSKKEWQTEIERQTIAFLQNR